MPHVILHGPRGDEWQSIIGTRTFPVRSSAPFRTNLPGMDQVLVYLVDLDALDPLDLCKIMFYLCTKFDLTPTEALGEIAYRGVPILAEDCELVEE